LFVRDTEIDGINKHLIRHEDDPLLETVCHQFEEMAVVTKNEDDFVGVEEGKEEKSIDLVGATGATLIGLKIASKKQKKRWARQENLKKMIAKQKEPQPSTKVQGMSVITRYDDLPSNWRRSRIRRDKKRTSIYEETNLKQITLKRVEESQKLLTKLVPLSDFKVKSTAWEGSAFKLRSKSDYTLEELESMGMEIIQWDGM
jgi:hypothetical protein